MNYLRLLYAIFIGALMTIATRFGPSLTIFAFVYLSRYSMEQSYSTPMQPKEWLTYYLPVASILIGLGAYFTKLALKIYSNKVDHSVLPFVDYLVLRHIEKGSMSAVTIRSQSVLALRICQTLILLLFLTGVVSIVSIELSLISFSIIVFSAFCAFRLVRKQTTAQNFASRASSMESLIEQVMMIAMVVGCVVFVPRDQWLHAAVGLFVLARFFASYRLFGKSILQWSIVRQIKPITAKPLPLPKPPKPVAPKMPVPKPPTIPVVIAATAAKPD